MHAQHASFPVTKTRINTFMIVKDSVKMQTIALNMILYIQLWSNMCAFLFLCIKIKNII